MGSSYIDTYIAEASGDVTSALHGSKRIFVGPQNGLL